MRRAPGSGLRRSTFDRTFGPTCWWTLALIAGAALAACDGEPAPRARAQRIAASRELIGGPKAIGRIGDYLLENGQIRVIIHDAGPGRASTPYGGSMIDADLVRIGGASGDGADQLSELLPSFLLGIIRPVSVEVTADGSDGGPASVTVRGEGADDLLHTVLTFDADRHDLVVGCPHAGELQRHHHLQYFRPLGHACTPPA